MKFLLPIILLCISQNVFGEDIPPESIYYDHELSYQELKDMNMSCYQEDLCLGNAEYHYPVPRSETKCSCHRQCWEYGTCCIDSPHVFKRPIKKCRNVGVTLHDRAYYMVDRCPDETRRRSIWKIRCEKKWNEEDDLLMFSPVTSLDTSRTYKNYYCFKCHETTDNYVSWDLLVDTFGSAKEMKVNSVFYDQEQKTWMATYDENHISFPVNISFSFPNNRQAEPIFCEPDMFVDCPDTWTDRRVREKCLAYNALVYQEDTIYKNVHCAVCNYVPLDVLSCRPKSSYPVIHFRFFKHLIDVSNGDKAGNAEKCEKNHEWDPYVKKCRKLSCPIPGYVIKKARCVRPRRNHA